MLEINAVHPGGPRKNNSRPKGKGEALQTLTDAGTTDSSGGRRRAHEKNVTRKGKTETPFSLYDKNYRKKKNQKGGN